MEVLLVFQRSVPLFEKPAPETCLWSYDYKEKSEVSGGFKNLSFLVYVITYYNRFMENHCYQITISLMHTIIKDDS